MARFYNPYHFVPVEKPTAAQRSQFVPRQAFETGELPPTHQHVTHERYVPGTHSGRLIVRLTTVTPTVIGGEQPPRANPNDFGTVNTHCR